MNIDRNLAQKLWIHWGMTGDQIIQNTNLFIKRSLENNRTLLRLDIGDPKNLPTFMKILADDITELTMFHSLCSFLQFVSPSPTVRRASYQSDSLLNKYGAELNIRKNLYDKITLFHNIIKAHNFKQEDIRFVKTVLDGFKRAGVLLSETAKDKLLKVREEVSKLENGILYNLNTFDTKLVGLTPNELEGLPSRYRSNLPVVSNNPLRFGVTLDKFSYTNCMRFLKDDDIRRKLELCYGSKSFDIVEDIARLIVLRDKHAMLLGFKNHSEYRSNNSTLKTSNEIKDFILNSLYTVDKKYQKEVQTLSKLKGNKSINIWDLQYYIHRWKKEYGVSDSYIRQFFPANHVVKTILEIYHHMMKLNFVRVKKPFTWHRNVSMYGVYTIDNTLLGYFYLDLFARKGKYKNTRCFCLQPNCCYPMNSDNRQLPIVALVSSIMKVDGKTTLLNYPEVVSLFHEFGHVLHHILGYSKYCLFSGTKVETDFVETPAQILDYLCWETSVIKKLSCHYRTRKPLPDDKINKIVKVRDLDIGIHYKKHSLIAVYDQVLHSSKTFVETCEKHLADKQNRKEQLSIAFANLYKQLHTEIFKGLDGNNQAVIGFNNGILFPGLWLTYLVGGDSRYYSHIYSRIYAADVYYKYKGDLDQLGFVLRDRILLKGGNVTAKDIYMDVLGRKPDTTNFAKLHDLEIVDEYSYFLNTDQIKNNTTTEFPTTTYPFIESDDSEEYIDDDSVVYTNRFSEINPDSVSSIHSKIDKIEFIRDNIEPPPSR